jgi:hypothetical protein
LQAALQHTRASAAAGALRRPSAAALERLHTSTPISKQLQVLLVVGVTSTPAYHAFALLPGVLPVLLLQALNLIKAGYKVVVWNRSADKCEPLKAAGATVSRPFAAAFTYGLLTGTIGGALLQNN